MDILYLENLLSELGNESKENEFFIKLFRPVIENSLPALKKTFLCICIDFVKGNSFGKEKFERISQIGLQDYKYHLIKQIRKYKFNDALGFRLLSLNYPKTDITIAGKDSIIGFLKTLNAQEEIFQKINSLDFEKQSLIINCCIINKGEVIFNYYEVDINKEYKKTQEFIKTCHFCGQDAKKKCSRCKLTKYCSLECQKKDWASHKLKCSHNKPITSV